jgi:phage-related protein
MPEKIGLIAELDLSSFNRKVTSYISQINKMQTASANVARAINSSFLQMDGSSTRSINHVAGALQILREQAQSAKAAISSFSGATTLTRQLNNVTNAANRAATAIQRVGNAGQIAPSVNLGGIGSMLGGLGTGIGSAASGILGGIGGIGNSVSSLIGNITRPLASIVGTIGGVVRSFTGLASSLVNIFGTIIRSVSTLASAVIRGFSSMVSGVLRIIGSFATTIGIAFNTVLRTVLGIVSSLVGAVVGLFSSLVRSVVGIIGGLVSTLTSLFMSLLHSALSIIGNLVKSVVGFFTSLLQSITRLVGSLISGIISAFGSLLNAVMGIVKNLVSGIINIFSGLVSAIGRVISGLASIIGNIFSSILRTISQIVGRIASTVLGIFGGMVRAAVSIFEGLAKSVLGIVTTLANKIASTLKSIATNILDSYKELGQRLTQIMTVAAAAVTGAVVLAGNKIKDWLFTGIEGAAQFEQGMADIASVLRKTRAEVEPLAAKINEMGLDPNLVVSTGEAASVVEQLARNGVEMKDILDGAAQSAVLLANATGGDFATAADVATMAMQMFNMKATEFQRIADVSQNVINGSRIDLDDWKLALGNTGAAAGNLGISIEDTAAIIAGTVNLYHSARQAGTGYTNFLERLVPLTQESADEMKKLGLFTGNTSNEMTDIVTEITKTQERIAQLDPRLYSYDELLQAHTDHLNELKTSLVAGNSVFFDAQGAYEGNSTAIAELSKALAGASDEQQIASLRTIFGNDALETAIFFVNSTRESYAKLKTTMSTTGTATEAATTRTATLQARWRNLKDIWDTIQRQSGAKFNDMLLNIVKHLTTLTSANQTRIVDFFGKMAVALNNVVEKAMPWIEQMLPKLINNLEALAYYILEVVSGGDGMQSWLSKMSPWLKSLIERVIGAVNWVRKFWGEVLQLAGSFVKTFRPVIDFIANNIELKDVLMTIAGAILLNIVPNILRLAGTFILVTKGIAAVRKAWETDWGGIRTFFQEVWPKISKPLVDFINNLLTGSWEDAWHDAVTVVTTVLNELEKAVPPFFKTFVNLFSDILHGDWAGAWANIVTIAQNSFELILKFLDRLELPFTDFLVHVLQGAWKKVWADITAATAIAMKRIIGVLRGFNNPWTDFLADILEGKWNKAWEKIREAAAFSFVWIKDRLREMHTPFTNFILKILEGKWYAAWRDVRKAVVNAFNGIVEALDNLNNPFTEFIADVIRGRWFEAWDDFKIIFQSVVAGILLVLDELNLPFTNFIAKVIRGDWAGAWENITTVALTAFELLKTILTDFDQPWSDFLVNVLEGRWGEVWSTLQTWVTDALESIKSYLPEWAGSFITLIQQLVNGDWGGAWNTALTIVQDILDLVLDYVTPWALRMGEALLAFVRDHWHEAWVIARDFAVGILEEIKAYVPGWGVPFVTAIQQVLQGNFLGAWNSARDGVIDILDSIKEHTPEWIDPFINTVELLLQGRWLEAWNEARRGVTLALDELKTLVPSWMSPFVTMVQQMLNNEWIAAWGSAREGVILALDQLKTLVPVWLTPFITATQLLLNGDWNGAWNTARGGAIDALELIKDSLPTWMTPFITLVQQVLGSDWKGAWETAKEVALAALEPIKTWISDQGKVVYDWFATNMPESTAATETGFTKVKDAWDKFVAAATNTESTTNLDHLASVVITGLTTAVAGLLLTGTAIIEFLQGDWKKGWTTAGEALTTFGELPVINLIVTWFKETFPDAADAFMERMPAIQAAWDPVADKWPKAWNTISTAWGENWNPLVEKIKGSMSSITSYLAMTIEQAGLWVQAIEEIFSGEGSVGDRILKANELMKQSWELEKEFWKKDLQQFNESANTTGLGFGTGLVEGFKMGLYDGTPITKEALLGWTDEIKKVPSDDLMIHSPSLVFKDMAANTMHGFRDGITENMHITFEVAEEMTEKFIRKFDRILDNIPPMAADMLEKFRYVFQQNLHRVLDEVGMFVEAVIGKLSVLPDKARTVGEQLGDGLVVGLQNKLQAVQDTAAALASAAAAGVTTEAQIASPSKVFMELGRYMREGLIEGLGDTGALKQSFQQAAGVAQQMAQGMQGYSSALTNNYSYNTTNAPVQFGPIYVTDRMSAAEFEYRVKNIIAEVRS